jgi:hypothetical protein
MNRKGFFFTLDIILAVTVLVVGVVLLYADVARTPPTLQASLVVADVLNLLQTVRVIDTTDPIILELRINNTITADDSERTILDLMAILHNRGESNYAATILDSFTRNTAAGRYNVQYYLNNSLLFSYNQTNMTIEEAPTAVIGRRVILTSENDTVLVGPLVFEVRAW